MSEKLPEPFTLEGLPQSVASATLRVGPVDLVVHVLEDGQRVVEANSMEAFFEWLSGTDDFTQADADRVARFVKGQQA